MNRTVYLTGKVTGVSGKEVKGKFSQMAYQLMAMGYHVAEPIEITDTSKPWDDVIRTDIKKMLECDEVHLLPDWQDSKAAQLERDIALRLGMQVVYH